MDIASFLNADAQRRVTRAVVFAHSDFDQKSYLRLVLPGLMDIPLKQRLRRSSVALHTTLNLPYRDAIRVLLKALPHMGGEFRGEIVPDFIEVYGLSDFEFSLRALRDGTQYGSGEFAIRAYLQRDFSAAYRAMCLWATHKNEHVRRLASEGLRPRLPWAFQLQLLRKDPGPCFELLRGLMTDESKYVRTSVGNHLNDISKDNADSLLHFLDGTDQEQPTTRWITTRALRTLVKDSHQAALNFAGFVSPPQAALQEAHLSVKTLQLGLAFELRGTIRSNGPKTQKLVVDYELHFMKKNGRQKPKVFKLKLLHLAPGSTAQFSKSHTMVHHSTRQLYPGAHRVVLRVNGQPFDIGEFDLVCDR